ncbi:MAG: response regulator [Gemmatimonadaceae bacterium]
MNPFAGSLAMDRSIWIVAAGGPAGGTGGGMLSGENWAATPGEPARARESPPPPRRQWMLVIDDEASIRTAVSRFFTRRGWNVEVAENGRQGLDMLLARPAADQYAVIICDIRMPVMTGAELHDALLADRPDLLERLIFITGEVTSAEVVALVNRTSRPVLLKPFEFATLVETVELVRAKV